MKRPFGGSIEVRNGQKPARVGRNREDADDRMACRAMGTGQGKLTCSSNTENPDEDHRKRSIGAWRSKPDLEAGSWDPVG
jgi:hypothetical protein